MVSFAAHMNLPSLPTFVASSVQKTKAHQHQCKSQKEVDQQQKVNFYSACHIQNPWLSWRVSKSHTWHRLSIAFFGLDFCRPYSILHCRVAAALSVPHQDTRSVEVERKGAKIHFCLTWLSFLICLRIFTSYFLLVSLLYIVLPLWFVAHRIKRWYSRSRTVAYQCWW